MRISDATVVVRYTSIGVVVALLAVPRFAGVGAGLRPTAITSSVLPELVVVVVQKLVVRIPGWPLPTFAVVVVGDWLLIECVNASGTGVAKLLAVV